MQYTFMQILNPDYTPNFCPKIGIFLAFAPLYRIGKDLHPSFQKSA